MLAIDENQCVLPSLLSAFVFFPVVHSFPPPTVVCLCVHLFSGFGLFSLWNLLDIVKSDLPINPARALRALGLLLADGTPTGGRGDDFLSRQPDFFTETAVTPERKVEKSFPRWEINRRGQNMVRGKK